MGPHTITVFGGSGFVGRHLARRLAKTGANVRIAVRHPVEADPTRVAGDVGQVVARRCDITNDADVTAMVDGADWVINLVGVFSPSAKVNDAIHHKAAGRIAEAAKKAGAARMVHISALGADADSASVYQQSKARGERAVLDAFPEATVLRPSVMFGQGDGFLTRFAEMMRFTPALPVFTPRLCASVRDECAGTKFQPVWVVDVAEAIFAALTRADAQGKVFELGGPRVWSLAEVYRYLMAETGRKRMLLPVPYGLAMIGAALIDWFPLAPITRDQLKSLRVDNVLSGKKPGFGDLGFDPTPMTAVAPQYLKVFRADIHRGVTGTARPTD